ncbi:membrane protein [Gordonia phage Schwartz33]|nr:membrane protein [Gordonia phage Schwartz33]
MSLALDIILWLLIGLGILALSVIWALIVTASTVTILRFVREYKKASLELEKEEAGEEPPPHYY